MNDLGWRRLRAAAFLSALLALTLHFTATHDGDELPATEAEAWTQDFPSWRGQNDGDIHREFLLPSFLFGEAVI